MKNLGFRYKPSSQPTSSPSNSPTQVPPPAKPVFINFVVLVTTLFILVSLLMILFLAWHKKSKKRSASIRFTLLKPDHSDAKVTEPRKIQTFFKNLAPLELTGGITWLQLFRRRVITDHCYIALVAAAFDKVNQFLGGGILGEQPDGTRRTDREGPSLLEHGLVCVGKVVNILLVATVLLQLLYDDYGRCAQLHSPTDCAAAGLSHSLAYQLCHWDGSVNDSIRNSSFLLLHKNRANKTIPTIAHRTIHQHDDSSMCRPTKANSHFITVLTLTLLTLAATALLDKGLRFLAAHAACMPPLFPPRKRSRFGTQVVPSYSAAGPERKSGDEVLPFDEWAVALHPNNLDLEAASPQSQTRRFPLREDNCDDLQTAQSVKATVLRAARLKFMRETADYVSADQELTNLQQRWQAPEHPLRFNDWKPTKHVVVPSVNHPKRPPKDPGPREKGSRMEFLRRFAKSFLLRLYDFSDPYTATDLLLHSLANERVLVVNKLLRARERADRVRNEYLRVKASIVRSGADEHECDRRLDVYVMQRFLCEWFCGYRRKVVESLLFHGPQIHRLRVPRRRLQVVSFFFLPLYFAVAVTYVLWNGVFTIGSNYVLRGSTAATRHWSSNVWSTPSVLWFSAVLLCLAQDVIFGVGFSRVFVKQVWIPLLARREFVALHNVLSTRGRHILKRRSGLMLFFGSKSQPHSLLQHFHPVCRAARSFPHLPAARLLLSLTDCDLPLLPRDSGFMVSAFSASTNNRENPWYNGHHLWEPMEKESPLVSDRMEYLGKNLQVAASFVLALAAFYFKNGMSLIFYSLLCAPEWLQYLLSEVATLGMVNFFCMALYASHTYLPSPGGSLLTAWATVFAVLVIGGILYKLLVYDRQVASLNEWNRQREKKMAHLRDIDRKILRVRDVRSKMWVHSVAGGKHATAIVEQK